MNLTSLDNSENPSFLARHFPYLRRQLRASLAVGVLFASSIHLLLGAAVAALVFLATWRWPSMIGVR